MDLVRVLNLSNEFLGLRPEKIIKKSVLFSMAKVKKNPGLVLPEADGISLIVKTT